MGMNNQMGMINNNVIGMPPQQPGMQMTMSNGSNTSDAGPGAVSDILSFVTSQLGLDTNNMGGQPMPMPMPAPAQPQVMQVQSTPQQAQGQEYSADEWSDWLFK